MYGNAHEWTKTLQEQGSQRDATAPPWKPAQVTPPGLNEMRVRGSGSRPESSGAPSDGMDEHLVSLLAPASFEAEQYRTLRQLLERMYASPLRSVLAVSSPGIGDGKTTTAINLAGAFAQAAEARVLLMDVDLRRPSLMEALGLGLPGERGLVDAILDPATTLDDVVQRCPQWNLWVVPAGRPLAAPHEVLKSPRLGELLEEARGRYDYVVLDTAPLVPLPDCRVIERWIDAFLLVIRAQKTPRKLVEDALNVLDPDKVAGVILNGDRWLMAGYGPVYRRMFNGGRSGRRAFGMANGAPQPR